MINELRKVYYRGIRFYWRTFRPKSVTRFGVKLLLGDKVPVEVASWLISGVYEREEARVVEHCLDPDDVVLEVGTGMGLISLLCAKKVGPDRVHTFEANPALEEQILANYRANDLFPKHHIGMLGSAPGEVDFHVDENFTRSSAVHKGDEAVATIKTPVYSLMDEMRRIRPTFLVIDIEGGEYEFLNNIDDFLDVKKVAIEIHDHILGPEKVAHVERRLAEAGFVIDPVYSKGRQLFARKG